MSSMILTVNIPKRGQILTNGEVYETIFPDADVQIWEHDHKVRVEHTIGSAAWLSLDWWNAPYKGGEQNE